MSYRLFRVWGINIELHITFLLFILFFLLSFSLNHILFFATVFSIVLFHELIHSLVAKKSGVPVPRILLLPIGGLASIELPDDPSTELKVSLAGPLSNFFLAIISFALLKVLSAPYFGYSQLLESLVSPGFSLTEAGAFLSLLINLNILLGGFNMLPAFPMDGGRVFRSILALWIDYLKATRIAGFFGKIFSAGMIIFGLFNNIFLAVVGGFIYFAGGNETRMAALKKSFEGKRVGDIMCHDLAFANSEASLAEFWGYIHSADKNHYAVVDSSGNYVGIVDARNLPDETQENKISHYAKNSVPSVDMEKPVGDVLKNLLSNE
ncbi:MAG: hypothetical protein GF334_03225, partial [Candidatus Altiarchaeales archaeon]|nr:hypothetical protein [Candidatus Altiarchaeales archaeon]